MKKQSVKTIVALAFVCMWGGVNAVQADTFKILYGTPVYDVDGTTVLSVNPQTDFAGDLNETTGFDSAEANGNDAAIPIKGSVLNAKKSWTKYFSSPVTEGKVYFVGNHSASPNDDGAVRIVDSKGNEILRSMNVYSRDSKEYDVFTICGTGVVAYVRQPRVAFYGIRSFCIDLDARLITYEFRISSSKGKYNTLTGSVAIPGDITDVNGLSVVNSGSSTYIDSVSLYSQKSEIAKYRYDINYTFGGVTIDNSSANVVDGSVITAKTVLDVDGTKYVTIAPEPQTLTVTAGGTNILNIPVRKAYTATLNVNTTVNETTTPQIIHLVEADDRTTNYSYFYPKYALQDGVYYVCDNAAYGQSGVFTDGETIDIAVNYSTADETVVFFGEAENFTNNVNVTTGQADLSGGAKAAIEGQNVTNRGGYVGTLGMGRYMFVASMVTDKGRELHLRDQSSTLYATNTLAAVYGIGLQTAEFNLCKETTIVVNGRNSVPGKSNQSDEFDYILIKRIGDAIVSKSVPAMGYASFSAACNMTVPEGVKVYKAAVNNNVAVNLTQVETTIIPANTGVIIGAAEGEYTFTYTATEATADFSGNELIATSVVKNATVPAEGVYYGLTLNEPKFAMIQAGVQLTDNKAYLKASEESTVKQYSAVFGGGDTTGINNIDAAGRADNAYYTLHGVRVATPTKGLYIVNGKKVVVK